MTTMTWKMTTTKGKVATICSSLNSDHSGHATSFPPCLMRIDLLLRDLSEVHDVAETMSDHGGVEFVDRVE